MSAARPSAVLRKSRGALRAAFNLADHAAAAASFSWTDARRELDGFTYRELAELSNRFANALATLGIASGEAVFALAPRVPELYIAALGTWKARAVFCPLFSAFGPEPILTRMTLGHARALVTTTALYERKVAALRASLPELHAVLLTDAPAGAASRGPGVYSLAALLEAASAELVETLYPIIHPPQVAIVGFGALVVRPWCVDGAVVAAPVISATLSADHRVSDGHRGSEFLLAVADWLQRPVPRICSRSPEHSTRSATMP